MRYFSSPWLELVCVFAFEGYVLLKTTRPGMVHNVDAFYSDLLLKERFNVSSASFSRILVKLLIYVGRWSDASCVFLGNQRSSLFSAEQWHQSMCSAHVSDQSLFGEKNWKRCFMRVYVTLRSREFKNNSNEKRDRGVVCGWGYSEWCTVGRIFYSILFWRDVNCCLGFFTYCPIAAPTSWE